MPAASRLTSKASLRILATNDLVGALGAVPTSYGTLPGFPQLRVAADRLRTGRPSVWVDAGDLAGWSPHALLSGPERTYAAVSTLGIDAAACGNHDLDWGTAAAPQWAAALGAPLLAANADVGLPASTLLETPGGVVGVLGLLNTEPLDGTPVRPPTAELVVPVVEDLRRRGADVVVAAVHDGARVALSGSGQVVTDPEPIHSVVADWARHVDVVLAGHTLARCTTVVDGTPVLQPWAFGAEIAVIDIEHGRTHGWFQRVPAPPPDDAHQLPESLQAAAAKVHGHCPQPLSAAPDDDSLLVAVAEALLRSTGADVVVLPSYPFATQPAIDGRFAHQRAGPFSELDVLRLWPWLDDRLLTTTCSAAEVSRIEQALHGRREAGETGQWFQLHPVPTVVRVRRRREEATVVFPAACARVLEELVVRPQAFAVSPAEVREALRSSAAAAPA